MRFWIISAALWIGAVFLALSGANNYLFFAGFVVLQSIVLASAWN
ncbi:MAG: branched-chain amino acid ABC transporter permease, partial [Betaproteobacteria bacterium]|nr:branched-chain amino acid ABC transporter permease [Betaproteobacteria bacterium]